MITSENFKILWWGILVIVLGLFLYTRWTELASGNSTYFDLVAFLVWIGICLAPIFKEVQLFGVGLKQDIKELKNDVGHKLSILKTELKSSIEVSTANSNQIYVNTNQEPPKDSEIPDISAQINEALLKLGISPDNAVEYGSAIPSNSVAEEMLNVRLAFESLLRKYMSGYSRNSRRYPLGKFLRKLREVKGISEGIIAVTEEVIAICNYAVHGEKLTDAQTSLVRDSAPRLLRALEKELNNAL